MSINFNQLFTHQTNQSTSKEGSNIPKDQMAALVNSIGNTTIAACSQSSSAEFLSKEVVFKIPNQNPYQEERQRIFLRALEEGGHLSRKGTSTIGLKEPLSGALKQEECTTISDLFRKKFPLLTRSLLKRETEIPKFVVSLGYRDKTSLQIQAKQEIVFISSGSWIVKKTKEYTYNIGPKKSEEEVAVIGILVAEPNQEVKEELGMLMLRNSRRVPFSVCNNSSPSSDCRCLSKELLRKELAERPYVSKDKEKGPGQELYPFYVEISLLKKHPI